MGEYQDMADRQAAERRKAELQAQLADEADEMKIAAIHGELVSFVDAEGRLAWLMAVGQGRALTPNEHAEAERLLAAKAGEVEPALHEAVLRDEADRARAEVAGRLAAVPPAAEVDASPPPEPDEGLPLSDVDHGAPEFSRNEVAVMLPGPGLHGAFPDPSRRCAMPDCGLDPVAEPHYHDHGIVRYCGLDPVAEPHYHDHGIVRRTTPTPQQAPGDAVPADMLDDLVDMLDDLASAARTMIAVLDVTLPHIAQKYQLDLLRAQNGLLRALLAHQDA